MKRHKTIGSRIRNVTMFTVTMALLITFVVGAVYKVITERSEARAELEVLAEITALNSQSALMFNDESTAQEILDALEPNEGIVYAEIATAKGVVLARKTGDHDHADAAGWAVNVFHKLLAGNAFVRIERAVMMNNQVIGKVIIQSDQVSTWLEVAASIVVSLFSMLLVAMLSWLLIRRMQVHITRPIMRLSSSAEKIARTGVYSQRVEKLADDELGDLTDQFNIMLNEVEKRDQALVEQNNLLEREVQIRTQAIRSTVEELHSLLDSMAEGAYGADIEGNCTFVNASFLRILGYEGADEIIGKHIHTLIHHTHADVSLLSCYRMQNVPSLSERAALACDR